MRNRCTLLIDGNWLLQSRFYVLGKKFMQSNPDHVKSAATDDLVELMARSINIIINKFPCIDNMILVSDGGSWRKKITPPSQLSDQTYKGNRSRTSDYDWDYIFKALDILINTFNRNNITTSRHFDIEGDDWIWHWSRRLNNEGTNVLIWTIDNDLKQLVNVDKSNGSFTGWYNNDTGLYLHKDLNVEIDPLDFFMSPQVFNPTLEDIRRKSQSVTYITPDEIINSKIICGDAGDNIKPVFRFTMGSRHYRVTEKDWKSFAKKLNINTIADLINNKDKIAYTISKCDKYSHTHDDEKNMILEMINYNTQLVWLCDEVIPTRLQEDMDNCEYLICDMKYIRRNFRTLMTEDTDIQNIFDSI